MLPDSLALNPKSLDNLRLQAKQENGKEAVRGAAQQFESYFLQMMLRTMRQTLSQDGPFDSQGTKMFSEMFDQQVAQSISQSKGLGLADMLVQQMQLSLETQSIKAAPRPYDLPPVVQRSEAQLSEAAVSDASASAGEAGGKAMTPRSFVDKLWSHAVDAAAVLGVSPHLLLAQAALETGWGKHVLKAADGTDSNNLFNIKAGSRWEGPTVAKEVTEYVNGKPVKSMETFRAYDTPAEAFADYASLLSNNPRYAGALNQDAEGFISGLRQGGFATDPGYGDKLRRIIGSVALRQGLAA
jgi:flagellar protein FlgJ